MDEATVKQRIQEILRPVYKIDGNYLLMRSDIPLYRAAYTDGLEAAARRAEQMRVAACSIRNETSIIHERLLTIEGQIQKVVELEKQIRQHAKEMGHET